MKLKLSFIAATLLLLIAPFAQAQNFCNQTVIDQAHVIRNPQQVANAASTLINQGADVHVVTVNSASFQKYGQLAGVESYLESQCRNWVTNGTRKANLFVIMVAPNDRAKNMFLGSAYAGAFDIPATYSQLSNSYFKSGDFGTGLTAALQGTTNQALNHAKQQFAAQQRPVQPRTYTQTPTATYLPVQTQQANSGISGFAIFMVVMFVILALAIILYFVFRDSGTTSTTTTYVEPSYTPDYSSGYSSRSYRASAPGGTTIINNSTPQYDSSGNLITGVLLGEAIAGNRQPQVVVQPSYAPAYTPAPSYVSDPNPAPAPVQDAPDSTWEAPAEPTQTYSGPETTSFETQSADTSYEAPSAPDTDFGSSSSSDFGSSNNDSGF